MNTEADNIIIYNAKRCHIPWRLVEQKPSETQSRADGTDRYDCLVYLGDRRRSGRGKQVNGCLVKLRWLGDRQQGLATITSSSFPVVHGDVPGTGQPGYSLFITSRQAPRSLHSPLLG